MKTDQSVSTWTLRDLGQQVIRSATFGGIGSLALALPPARIAEGMSPESLIFADDFELGNLSPWSVQPSGGPSWTVVDYVRRGRELLASLDQDGDVRHFHLDHLGTPRLLTDDVGQPLAYHAYHPFGEEATSAATDDEVMKFTGHQRDLMTTTDLPQDDVDYLHARYRSPLTGRFLSVDPVGGTPKLPQSWNRYTYVQGNPLRYTDPTGEFIAELKAFFSRLFDRSFPPPEPEPMQNIEELEAEVGPTGDQFDQTAVERKTQQGLNEFGANAATAVTVGAVVIGTENAGRLAEEATSSAFSAIRLRRSLASAQQMGETGTVIAGPGSRAILRDAERLASQYGGRSSDWVKKSSSSYRGADGVGIETHWYENLATGQRVEPKTKIFN